MATTTARTTAKTAAGKQVQVDAVAYGRIVELAETAHCTMAHAASLLIGVADLDAAVERHFEAVRQARRGQAAERRQRAVFFASGSKPGIAPRSPSGAALGKPAAGGKPGQPAAAPASRTGADGRAAVASGGGRPRAAS